ncbi:DUF615 domain-containing protein [bacterium]|nr:DUF615 domain-containing protein [bacterium]
MEKNENSLEEKKSRTRLKKEMKDLQSVGEKLIKLSSKQLDSIQLPENLRTAVQDTIGLKKEARRRQMQYIGKLMRKINHDAIDLAIRQIEQAESSVVHSFHQLERWRTGLIAGDEAIEAEVFKQLPSIDQQQLNQLVRNSQKESSSGKPPKSSRALFRYLCSQMEKKNEPSEM